MTWFAPPSQTIAFTNNTAGDGLFVGPAVQISASGSSAVLMQSHSHEVIIYGTVVGNAHGAVSLGGNAAAPGPHLEIKSGAVVASFGNFFNTVDATGVGTTIVNEGTILSRGGGIVVGGVGGTATVVNSGTIQTTNMGIWVSGPQSLALNNSGLIDSDIAGVYGSSVADTIINTGRIVGRIDLGGGNDTYNGASGHIIGKVLGGDGADTIIGGSDNDRFEGGIGNDTLIGNLGVDTLDGGAGNDVIRGGKGRDILTGGADKDFFVFDTALSATTNVDLITDFSHVDDTIRLSKAIFKALGAAAHDADDHIIYNPANGRLYYDDDGNGAHAQVLFATLGTTTHPTNVAYNDFVVI
jgi:Ca2+-binding RTX toxin-like protein